MNARLGADGQSAANRKKIYVFLTPKGRMLKAKLVLLAQVVNKVAVRGGAAADVAATLRTLLPIIENLAQDEIAAPEMQRSVPFTRELGRPIAGAVGNKRRCNRGHS